MELRAALLVVGLLLVAVVFYVSQRKYRLPRPSGLTLRRRSRGEVLSEPLLTPFAALESDAENAPAAEPQFSADAEVVVDTAEQEEAEPDDEQGEVRAEAQRPRRIPRDQPDFESHSNRTIEERQIDFVARLPGQKVVRRDTALGVYRQNEYLLDKPHRIFGLSQTSGMWRDLEREPESGRYTDLALSVQLVDREGPISESELTKFSLLVLRLSEALKRRFKFSMSFEEAQEQGKDLQEFCRDFDVIAVVNVVAQSPEGFTGKDIDECAREFDMQLGKMNIYHKRVRVAGKLRYVFSMANLYKPGSFDPSRVDSFTTKGVTMFMNMPCTIKPARAFGEMVTAARGICERINGKLVDQKQHALTDKGIQLILEDVDRLAREMEAKGIVPGSDAAIRLF